MSYDAVDILNSLFIELSVMLCYATKFWMVVANSKNVLQGHTGYSIMVSAKRNMV